MSDEETLNQQIIALVQRLDAIFKAFANEVEARVTALEAELAVLRGTLSAPAWAGDSARMTIEPPTE
jgi:hypothetical protein